MSDSKKIVSIHLERMSHGPNAVGKEPSGRTIMAYGGAPSEWVDVRIRKEHKRYAEGDVIRVETPSPFRREPPCMHARSGECGGCAWQHIAEKGQQEQKQQIVVREVSRVAPEAIVHPIRSDIPAFGYRRRARLGYRNGLLGYRRPRERRIFDVEQCPVLDPRLEAALPRVREAITGRKSGNIDILLDSNGDVLIGKSAQAFAQASVSGERALIELVLMAVPESSTKIIELFCGSGTFTIPLVNRGHQVIGWEYDKSALRRLNRLKPSIKTVRMDLLKSGKKFDFGQAEVVVLDPPRAGAAPCIPGIVETDAHTIVYVSCAPMTLCRDLAQLKQHGFCVDWVQPLDAFPQTHHIECVAKLSRE